MQSTPIIRLVCATRETREGFLERTPLGRSLATGYVFPHLQLRLFESNRAGLPMVYNIAIEEARQSPAILVFIHDDVWLTDHYWSEHLLDAVGRFDVVGLAGNKRRVPRQSAWAFVDDRMTLDAFENFSGRVGHGRLVPPDSVSEYGPVGQEVKLLDGLFLAARSELLHAAGLCFDERFAFHFYDLDFCREAEVRGVSMGTAAIAVVHASAGAFEADVWRTNYERYLEKWGE